VVFLLYVKPLHPLFSVKTQLLQCNLTVCFTHPEKMACLQTDVETPTWLSGAQMMED